MPFTHDQAVAAGRARWAGIDRDQRRDATRAGRVASAVRTIVDNWPELRPEQVARLRGLLQPPGAGGPDA
jgi:hypothetical protein